MKILFFVESLRAGGRERRMLELFKCMKAEGIYEMEIVITKNLIHYPEIYDLSIPIHIIERKFIKKDPRLFFKFYKIAKKFKPDIIHVWGHMVAFYSVPTKLLLGVPLINNEIVDSTVNQFLIGKNLVFKVSDRIIANTYAGLKAYNAPMHKSTVIYNGFSFNRTKSLEAPESVRARFVINTKQVVAMVASFLKLKDHDTYIKAALRVLEKNNDVTFLCIGDGDDSEYRKMVPEKFMDKILFLGRQTQVESIMNVCTIGVLTTNTKNHGEGISNALLEFMALKKPVITTNFGGSVELVEDNVSGFLIDPFSVDQLVEKLEYLLPNEAVRLEMGECNYVKVKEKFSMEAMYKSFQAEYANILKQSNGAKEN